MHLKNVIHRDLKPENLLVYSEVFTIHLKKYTYIIIIIMIIIIIIIIFKLNIN